MREWGYVTQQTATSSQPVLDETILAEIKKMMDGKSAGVGTRSHILVCHPDNYDALIQSVRAAQQHVDAFVSPYRVFKDEYVPREVTTNELDYHDELFVTYSDGPVSDMSQEEYKEMCEYFGWGERHKSPGFFELEGDTFQKVIGRIENKINIERGLFSDIWQSFGYQPLQTPIGLVRTTTS